MSFTELPCFFVHFHQFSRVSEFHARKNAIFLFTKKRPFTIPFKLTKLGYFTEDYRILPKVAEGC